MRVKTVGMKNWYFGASLYRSFKYRNRGKCNFVIKLIMFEIFDIDKLPSLSTSVGFMVAHF